MNINKKTDTPPSDPRKWLATVRNILGASFIINLFRVDQRTVTRWIAQRPYVSEDSVRENYLEHHETLLTRLMDDGYHDIARAIVMRHAEMVGCDMVCRDVVEPDKDTIEGEMLEDYPAIMKFHEAIQSGENIGAVLFHLENARKELNETVEMYRRETGKQ